ncbi:hypothetical protein [Actinomadura oligospora]|uniref:hypothetical protein n=1 Tax=Actinomadura oligospora TaxID=111804 RepID=UPI00047CF87D|nr:hypothetical protein [Actinomadura oligospora]
MSPRLHDALHELAQGAPSEVSAAQVLAGARRRRRVRLIAVPSVAATAAAAILVGATLAGGGAEPARPAAQPDRPLVTEPGKVLNPPGVLPGRLPSGKVEPIVFAFLDYCRGKSLKETTSAKGDCAQWRLVGRSGKQWRLPDAVGSRVVKPEDYMSGSAPLVVSPDGWRIAYYRAKDQRLVVRDLTSGRVTPVSARTAPAAIPLMMFSGDGTRLALSPKVDQSGRTLLVDTRTGAATALHAGTVIGLSRDASTIVQADTEDERTPLTVSGADGSVRASVPLDPEVDLRGSSGNLLSPDGRTLLTFTTSLDKAVLVDVATGKITSVRRIDGVGGAHAWTGPTTYFTTRDLSGHPDARKRGIPPRALRGVIVDLTTGKYRDVGRTFTIQTSQSAVALGGYLP